MPWSPDCLWDLRWWLRGDRLSRLFSVRFPRIWTFGPTLPMSAGGLTWETGLFPAFGNSRRLFFQSMPGRCWQCVAVSSTSSPFCPGPWWPCFATTSPESPICARRGGTRSPVLTTIAQEILRWAESLQIRLAPQFIPGIRNVLADSLSRPHQLPSSEWSLNMDVFRSLTRQWPVMIDLFATSDNHRCSIYFSPYRDPVSAGTDALLQSMVHSSSGIGEASGVPPDPPHPHRPLLALTSVVRGPPPVVVGGSSSDSFCVTRPPLPASVSSTLPGSPQAGPSCLETIQRFTRAAGFSSAVAAQASLARRPSSRSNYQLKWSVYRSWCRSQGHSISRPSLSKVADFLWWLRSVRGLSVSSIKGYRSMLSC